MEIGKMKISEVYPYLKEIADEYGLRLNRVNDFKLVRMILANRWNSNLI